MSIVKKYFLKKISKNDFVKINVIIYNSVRKYFDMFVTSELLVLYIQHANFCLLFINL